MLTRWNQRSPGQRVRRVLVLVVAIIATGCLTAVATPPPETAVPSTVHANMWPVARSRGLVDAKAELRITTLIRQMTVEEKVGQIIQADVTTIEPDDLRRFPLGAVLAGAGSGVHHDDRAPPAAWLALAREFRSVAAESRPNHVPIPVMFGIDAVHGHNNIVGAVIFPHNIGLGAAGDPELVRRIGAATAEEVAATGLDWTFAPTLAVPQDRRWGRLYEGYSEDPVLVRRLAGAMVEGLQGTADLAGKIQMGRVAATAKHFVADGGTSEGVDQGDAAVAESDLIATHAQGYIAAIDAGVMTVMASYSSWNGQKMHANRALLTDVLKGRMGFDGFVVGDWNGHAQVPGCTADRCAAAINAGVDMVMAPQDWKDLYQNTLSQVEAGEIPIARLDDAVRRILRVKIKLGLLDGTRPFDDRQDLIGSAAHRAIGREAVRRSLVLLKNDGVLPIKASARVLVTGQAADDIGMQCGGWTVGWQGTGNKKTDFPGAQSIRDGIKAALAARGGTLVHESNGPSTDVAAGRPDVAIVVFGERPYAEMFGDVKIPLYNDRHGLTELTRLRKLGIPVVAVFLSGRPLWVNAELNQSDAFVVAWLPGTEGGGIADVLIGDGTGKPRTDFTAKLPFRWPSAATMPPYARGDAYKTSLFPRGYGLSYAQPESVRHFSEDLDGL
jgi:beta-glucosidase